YFPTHDDLYAFRSGVLHRIDGVVSSQVAIVLRIDKQIYLWNLQRDDSAAPVPVTPEPLALAGPEYRARVTDLDRAIIECLQRDGRIPYADLAARVGVSQVTAARRVEQLLQDGVIRVVAVVNPYRVGLNCPAILGVNVDLHRQPEVMRALCRHPRLTYVAATTGEFDAVVVGYFADNQDLARFVVRDLARVPGVRRVNTSVLFDIPKHSYDWGSVALPAHGAQSVPPARRQPRIGPI
ncbi:MAG TPA: Lrp/AsnC family transcriptional regulator, partial [Bacillota bacterium]